MEPKRIDIFENVELNNDDKEYFKYSDMVSEIIIKLISRRLELNMSQRDLAKISGIKQPMIVRIEKFDSISRLDTVVKIADALGMTIDFSMENVSVTETYYLNSQSVVKKAEEANLLEDILFSVYGIHSNDYYDAAIIAPSWLPEKLFPENAKITMLQQGSYNSSYEVLADGMRIAYIQSGAGASTVADATLCLSKSNIKNIFFIGAVGSISKDIPMSSVVTPSECISFDGVTPFYKTKIDVSNYGSVIKPDNMDYVDSLIDKAKSIDVSIIKEKVFVTNSILLEYSHMDEILATGAKLIEMETAAFISALNIMGKNGMPILVVSDNSQDKKSLVCKDPKDKEYYNYVRSSVIRKLLQVFITG